MVVDVMVMAEMGVMVVMLMVMAVVMVGAMMAVMAVVMVVVMMVAVMMVAVMMAAVMTAGSCPLSRDPPEERGRQGHEQERAQAWQHVQSSPRRRQGAIYYCRTG